MNNNIIKQEIFNNKNYEITFSNDLISKSINDYFNNEIEELIDYKRITRIINNYKKNIFISKFSNWTLLINKYNKTIKLIYENTNNNQIDEICYIKNYYENDDGLITCYTYNTKNISNNIFSNIKKCKINDILDPESLIKFHNIVDMLNYYINNRHNYSRTYKK